MHLFKSMIFCHINFGNLAPYIYFHEIHSLYLFLEVGFTSMLLLFKVLPFLFQLVYQTAFIHDNFSSLVNLPHQFHYKLNVVLILELYLFSFFSQLFNGMTALIQVSLATRFYSVSIILLFHILLDSIIFFLYLSNILFFSLRIS